MTAAAPQAFHAASTADCPVVRAARRKIRRTRRAVLGWLVTGTLTGSLLTPAHSATKPKPQTVSLRLASVNQKGRLMAPGLAMSRATRTLAPGQSLTFVGEQLRRPVAIDSHPFLRLHLSHTVPGDVVLYVAIQVVGAEGSVRVLLPSHGITAAEAVLAAGPQGDVDARLPHVRGTLAPNEQLEVVISELGSGPTDALHPDLLTVYLGALPNEDTDIHDIGQVNDEAKGGKDPARLSLSVTGTGPFQMW